MGGYAILAYTSEPVPLRFGAPLRSHLPQTFLHPSQPTGFLCNSKYLCTLFITVFFTLNLKNMLARVISFVNPQNQDLPNQNKLPFGSAAILLSTIFIILRRRAITAKAFYRFPSDHPHPVLCGCWKDFRFP